MYIKLTRFDNRPVWLNASFIVTVEPRRDGKGAVVVPIGDGLDYDVRETPEQVLAMLEGAPEPKVVPVPVSDCLTKTPEDVSPEPEPRHEERERPVERPAAKPAEKPVEKPVVKPAEPVAEPPAEKPAEEKPKRKPRTRKTAANKERPPEPVTPPQPPAKLELSETDVARLRKLAPKSVAKLKNTLATQFRVADVGGNVAALVTRGDLSIEGNRVTWKAEIADW